MAQKFGVEEGNEQLGAVDLFPDLIIPSDPEEATTDVSSDGETTTEPDGIAETTDAAQDPSNDDEEKKVADASSAKDDGAFHGSNAGADREVATARTEDASPARASASYSIWAVAGVLVVALGLLFVATLVILRPR